MGRWVDDAASSKRLTVRCEFGIFSGVLIHKGFDMSVEIVSLPSQAPQLVADRVAAAYSAIVAMDLPAGYLAVMPLSKGCRICHRPLTDRISKVLRIGPYCARQLGVAHTASAASTIIAQRHTFLAELARQVPGRPT